MTMASTPFNQDRGAFKPGLTYQELLDLVFPIWILGSFVAFIEPSPYDFLATLAIPVWLVGGFSIHRVQALIVALWTIFLASGFIALAPYWDDSDARTFQFLTLYLAISAFCFTFYFGTRTIRRVELCLRAYTLAAFIAGAIGVFAYFHVIPSRSFVIEGGRAAATFKDPNVFGSYLIPAILFTFQDLLIGAGILRIFSLGAFGILITGVLVSYSRGSWGTAILALLILIFFSFITANNSATRRRIVIMTLVGLAAAALFLIALLSLDNIREFFLERATIQNYDAGATGRFGNQIHAIPMLLDRPWGFGPLRFRRIFEGEPHNTFVGAFANTGWLGGLTWILIVLTTCFIGFRLMLVASPFRRLAQVVFPGLFAIFLQCFQIDVDHWRQLYLLMGMTWALEAARLRWRAQNAKSNATANPARMSRAAASATPAHLGS
jgi:hypothetical protein